MKGFPGNIQQLMKQAQKMQDDIKRAQSEAENFSAEGSAGGGMVKVVANGKHQLMSIQLDPQVVNPNDIEMLQDLILAASNDALTKVQDRLKDEMSKITAGMNIPGLF